LKPRKRRSITHWLNLSYTHIVAPVSRGEFGDAALFKQ
jgi:hypothetical protein